MTLDCSLCVVNQAKGSICSAVVVAGSELGVREDIISVGIREDASGDDLLKELSAAFKKANGVIGFGKAIIRFVWLRYDDNQCVFPRVETEGDGHIENRHELIWSDLKCPFKECIVDARGAWSRLVRGWRNGSRNLFLGDRWEVTWW